MAAIAEERKKAKYTCLSSYHIFTPVVVETAGVFGPETSVFLRELIGHLRRFSGEEKSHACLLQRLSVAVQRGNAAAVLGTIQPPAYSDTFFQS